jgi:hypothetical protein
MEGLASQARALSEHPRSLAQVATYDPAARATLRTGLPVIMTVILNAAGAGAQVFDDPHWVTTLSPS